MTRTTTWPIFASKRGLQAFLSLLLIVAGATALALIVRWRLVEPEVIAQACASGDTSWRCAVREFAVFGFLNNVFGWVGILAGVLATVSRWRWLAALATVAGIAGAVLYTFELSGVGILLGTLVWIQRSPLPESDRGGEQRA